MRRLVSAAALLAATGSTAYAQNTLPQTNDAYFRAAQAALQERLQVTPNTNRAKNVILFVGDGMGISTVTAGRIYEGQKRGVDGESNALTMEKLPYAALSKTYTHDAQVADSAPTAVADPEDKDRKGSRKDGRNLVQEWQSRYSNSGVFLWNKEQFDRIDAKTPRVLGLFERSHMRYEADRLKDNGGEPSLAELAVKSIEIGRA